MVCKECAAAWSENLWVLEQNVEVRERNALLEERLASFEATPNLEEVSSDAD